MQLRIIGISGLKTSGKDTTFQMVDHIYSELHPDRVVTRAGFADKLKIMAARALGLEAHDETLIHLMDDAKENWLFDVTRPDSILGYETIASFTGRQYLQWFGGNARIVFGETFWIDQVLPVAYDRYWGEELTERYPGVDVLCITDVRYPNEAERILDLNGEIWRVDRPGLASDGHSSEIPLKEHLVQRVIDNKGSFADLEVAVKELI
jgi:hypothetical protein